FIASSFVLPPSTKKMEKQFNELKIRYNSLLSNIQSIKAVKNELDKIENIDNEIIQIKNRELKSIEILGIFSGIIAFIFGSISSYSFIKTPYQAILFTSSFAFSLIFFIAFFISFIRFENSD